MQCENSRKRSKVFQRKEEVSRQRRSEFCAIVVRQLLFQEFIGEIVSFFVLQNDSMREKQIVLVFNQYYFLDLRGYFVYRGVVSAPPPVSRSLWQ